MYHLKKIVDQIITKVKIYGKILRKTAFSNIQYGLMIELSAEDRYKD